MEITKHGIKNRLTEEQKFVYKFVCPKCGCEFNCFLEELHTIEKSLNGKRTAICPECGEEVEHKFNQLV